MEILADKLRPNTLNDIIGQSHLIGENKIISNLISNKKLFSLIFYGSPGCGKTTLANVIINELDVPSQFLNATINNKGDFESAIQLAKLHNDFILVIDEIHRMNKDKQDLLLPYIEKGTIILIGLTTTNPYFTINPAIRSRVHIFELKPISSEDIKFGIKNICKSEFSDINIEDKAIEFIANISNGDYRYALNLLELAVYTKTDSIDLNLLESINPKPIIYSDKNGSDHYNLLSALQKSIRGSDPDASIHYLARLLEISDFESLKRRLAVIVYEDIGLANPQMGPKLETACNFFEVVGMPEGRIILGQIVLEMALSPKSNSSYMAINEAINDVKKGNTGNIPKNIVYKSKSYIYPHNFKNSYVKQNYLPSKLTNKKYYYKKNNHIENNINKLYENMKNS